MSATKGDDQRLPGPRAVGQTRDVGFIIGARKTFDVPPHLAWDALISADGIRLWLGEAPDLAFVPGARYRLPDDTVGEVRVFEPGSHLRLTWQPPEWYRASTIQLRTIPSRGKTAVSFHQEQLPDAVAHERMRQRWYDVLRDLAPPLAKRNA